VLEDVGAVLVEVVVRDRLADLAQPGRPAQQPGRTGQLVGAAAGGLAVQRGRELGDRLAVPVVEPVAADHARDRDLAHVGAARTAEQVVQHPFAQRAVAVVHRLHAELLEHRAQHREAPGQHRAPVGLERGEPQAVGVAGLQQRVLQRREHRRGQPRLAEVGLRDLPQRLGGSRRADRRLPARLAVACGDRRERVAAGVAGGVERGPVDRAVGEEPAGQAHAAERDRLELLGHVVGADDALGRAAADVDHQPSPAVDRQRVRRPEVDQPRLLAPGDHLDAEAQRLLGALEEGAHVARDAERVGGDRPHALGRERAQPLAEAAQRVDRAGLCGLRQRVPVAEARREPHRLLQLVHRADLVAERGRFDPSDDQPEAVGAEVDGGEQEGGVGHPRDSAAESRHLEPRRERVAR